MVVFFCNIISINAYISTSGGYFMNIYVYSDESGVFDKIHNEYFVFGGLILLGNDDKEKWSRIYSSVEDVLRTNKGVDKDYELKATQVTNKEKANLFRSLNNCYKFAIVVEQSKLLDELFLSKKDKQKFLDYAYNIAVKDAFQNLINKKLVNPDEVERLYFYVDEHTTATNGIYELNDLLEQVYKRGTYNFDYSVYYEPIFKNIKDVNLEFCNSASKLLIRAADIVANRVYYLAKNDYKLKLSRINNINLVYLP